MTSNGPLSLDAPVKNGIKMGPTITRGHTILWLNKNTSLKVVRDGLPDLYPRLWRFCLTLTKNRAAADDLAQTACERALKNAEKFQPGTNLDSWVFTIARRLWLNELRSTKVRRGEGLVPVEDADLPDEKIATETNIFAHQVLDLVQALPEAQRMVVLLVYVEGYSYREAAEIADVPIGTVMSRLATARKTISARVDMKEKEKP